MANFSDKTNDEIDSWIANYESKKATDKKFYLDLLEERAKRHSKALNINKSMEFLIRKAREGIFVSYGDLAKENNAPWNLVRHAMNGKGGHLDSLLDVCHARGLPLLTALCVNQSGVATGELAEGALEGFVNGAKRLGYPITDGISFLRECQKKSFEWAANNLEYKNVG